MEAGDENMCIIPNPRKASAIRVETLSKLSLGLFSESRNPAPRPFRYGCIQRVLRPDYCGEEQGFGQNDCGKQNKPFCFWIILSF